MMTEQRLDVLIERAKGLHVASGGANAFSELAKLVARETGQSVSKAAEFCAKARPEFYREFCGR